MLWHRGAGFLGGSPPGNPSFIHLPLLHLPICSYYVRIDNRSVAGKHMSEKRVLRKMKKLALRITDKMETVRDVMEDLEIEFELLQKQISKLESKKGIEITDENQEEVDIEDEVDEIIDLENTSVVTVRPKF